MAAQFVERLKAYFKTQNHKEVKLLWERMQKFKASAEGIVETLKAENIGINHFSKTEFTFSPSFFMAEEMNTKLQPQITFIGWNREKNLIAFCTVRYSGSVFIKLHRVTDWDSVCRHVKKQLREVKNDPAEVDLEMERNEPLFGEDFLKSVSDDSFKIPFSSLSGSSVDLTVMLETLKAYVSMPDWDK